MEDWLPSEIWWLIRRFISPILLCEMFSPIPCYEWCVGSENGCCVRNCVWGWGKTGFLLKTAGYDTKETMEFRRAFFPGLL